MNTIFSYYLCIFSDVISLFLIFTITAWQCYTAMDENDSEQPSKFRSLFRLSLDELNIILNKYEKLDMLPNPIHSNIVYRLSLTDKTQDIWKIDGYKWKTERTIPYPTQASQFNKTYYTCYNSENKNDARCVKHVYVSRANCLDVIVCYIGNLDIAARRPHGNSESSDSHIFHRVLSSTTSTIDGLVTTMSGSKAYKQLVATSNGIDAPRNVAQCHYRRRKFLQQQQQQRMTSDELNNLVLLSFKSKSFFKLFQIEPELLVVLIHDAMKDEFCKLVRTAKETIPLFYDTIFSLCDTFVSIVGYRHTMFKEEPIIPLIILFHDKKDERTHLRFIQILHQEIPDIAKNCVLITDGENALKNAFRFYYPQVEQLRCWNHLSQNIQTAGRRNIPFEQIAAIIEQDPTTDSVTKREIVASLTQSVKDLLRSKSRTNFENLYEEISVEWPPKFRQWFDTMLLPTIDEMGGWSSCDHELFNEISGVTANPIERLNAVFKRWLAWKELSLDSLAQMFYLVTGFYVNEVKRGFCGVGNYHLWTNYASAKMDYSYLCLVKAFSPDEVVKHMQEVMREHEKPVVEVLSNNRSIYGSNSLSSSSNADAVEVNETTDHEVNRTTISHSSTSGSTADTIQHKAMSDITHANLLNEQDLVQFDVKAKAFTVRSLDRKVVHAVHMNDRRRLFHCSCASIVEQCIHVLAVQVYLGMSIETQKKLNLGHERKKRRMEEKVGKPERKRPRRCNKKNQESSQYFTSNTTCSTNNKPRDTSDFPASFISITNAPLPMTSLQNISNIDGSAVINQSTPRAIRSIQFLTPRNLTIVPSQQNQVHFIPTRKPDVPH